MNDTIDKFLKPRKYWIVMRYQGKATGANMTIHDTREAADCEAQERAQRYCDRFVVLEAVGSIFIPPTPITEQVEPLT